MQILKGKGMAETERRHPKNAQLREKIKRIQEMSHALQTVVEQVQGQTVAWAREGKIVDLPNAALANSLVTPFQNLRVALTQIQKDIEGATVYMGMHSVANLITDEELAVLMK